MKELSEEELEKALSKISAWHLEDGALVQTFDFENFSDTLVFANKVAEIAEEENHHPDIFIFSCNHVRLTVYSREVDGVTRKCVKMAEKIDTIK